MVSNSREWDGISLVMIQLKCCFQNTDCTLLVFICGLGNIYTGSGLLHIYKHTYIYVYCTLYIYRTDSFHFRLCLIAYLSAPAICLPYPVLYTYPPAPPQSIEMLMSCGLRYGSHIFYRRLYCSVSRTGNNKYSKL